jgi:hypothetical protein
MVGEPHDVVKLLLKRMESHPEEFKFRRGGYHQRWYDYVNSINEYGNEADKAAISAKMRDIRLAEVHEQVMEELCNGPERRRIEEEENEYEKNMSKTFKALKASQLAVGTASSDMNPIRSILK